MFTSSSIRVLQLGSPTELYGAERWILALVRHFPNHIESVVGVIKDALGGEPSLCAHAACLGVRTHIFESHGRLSLAAIGQLRRFIRDHDIDILHTHGYKTDLIGLLATRRTHCRTVATPHGWSTNAGFKIQFYEALDRLVFRFLDAVVPLSSDLYDGLIRLPGVGPRLYLIHNGVDLSEIDRFTEPAPEMQNFKAQGSVVIGYIGQLIPRKGLDTLLHAFHHLNVPGKHLFIVGDGPIRPDLERLSGHLGEKDNVHFLGFRQDRIALLKSFDVFVLPSKLEGIPRCLLEAMAAGVPVIATDIPGCRALVDGRDTGLLFQVDNSADLAAKLSSMLLHPNFRTSLANEARIIIRREYSATRMAHRYANLYREIMDGVGANSMSKTDSREMR